jgi:hypothetical protein
MQCNEFRCNVGSVDIEAKSSMHVWRFGLSSARLRLQKLTSLSRIIQPPLTLLSTDSKPLGFPIAVANLSAVVPVVGLKFVES